MFKYPNSALLDYLVPQISIWTPPKKSVPHLQRKFRPYFCFAHFLFQFSSLLEIKHEPKKL